MQGRSMVTSSHGCIHPIRVEVGGVRNGAEGRQGIVGRWLDHGGGLAPRLYDMIGRHPDPDAMHD